MLAAENWQADCIHGHSLNSASTGLERRNLLGHGVSSPPFSSSIVGPLPQPNGWRMACPFSLDSLGRMPTISTRWLDKDAGHSLANDVGIPSLETRSTRTKRLMQVPFIPGERGLVGSSIGADHGFGFRLPTCVGSSCSAMSEWLDRRGDRLRPRRLSRLARRDSTSLISSDRIRQGGR